MRKSSRWLIVGAVVIVAGAAAAPFVLGLVPGTAEPVKEGENERDVTIDEVPAAVRAAILKEAGDNKIEEIEEETENGVTTYEAEWLEAGKEIEIKVAPDGKILKRKVEEADDDDHEDADDDDDDGGHGNGDDDRDDDEENEEHVTLDQVPAAVKATILAEAGNQKIEEIEKENEDGATVYEAEWHEGGKEIEISVAPDGKLLKKEVDDDEADDDDDDK